VWHCNRGGGFLVLRPNLQASVDGWLSHLGLRGWPFACPHPGELARQVDTDQFGTFSGEPCPAWPATTVERPLDGVLPPRRLAPLGCRFHHSSAMEKPTYLYEPVERFGEGLTTNRPWNTSALGGVERLNGRVAMLGFGAAILGEWLTGEGIVGQLGLMLRWLLG